MRLTKQKPDSLIDGSLGRDTHGPEHRFRRPHAAEIGKANEKRDPPLVAAQGGHGLLRRFRRLGRRRKLRNRLFEMDVWIAQQAVGEQRRIALSDRRKIGRACQGARDQVAYFRIVPQELAAGASSGDAPSALVKLSMMSAPRALSQIAGCSAMRSKNAVTPALALVRTPDAPLR